MQRTMKEKKNFCLPTNSALEVNDRGHGNIPVMVREIWIASLDTFLHPPHTFAFLDVELHAS